MKPQDIVFTLVFLFLLYRFKPRVTVIIGLLFLVFSVPLFYFWIFFTAERLTWYAAGFFLLAIIQYMVIMRRVRS